MKEAGLFLVAVASVGIVGCASVSETGARNAEVKKAYVAQQRDMKVIEAEFVEGVVGNGQGGTITITGLKKLTLSNALTPLAAPAPEKNIVESTVDGVVKVAPYAAGAYVLGKAVDNTSTSTTTTSTTKDTSGGSTTTTGN